MALTKVPSNLDSITATTQSQGDGSTNVATTAYVDTGLNALIDSAPGNLNTLNELAAAMNDNASFFSTVLPLSGGTMTGTLILAGDDTGVLIETKNTSASSASQFKISHSLGSDVIQSQRGNLTLDVSGDIFLDAGSGGIKLKGAGTEFGSLENSSSDLQINASIQDKDILFKGNDGGSTITALTLDMSDAGKATFNDAIVASGISQFSDVNIPNNNAIRFGNSQDLQIYHDGTNGYITDAGTGGLYMPTSGIYMRNAANSAGVAYFVDGGAVTLYYNGTAKLATGSSGVDVAGNITLTNSDNKSHRINSSTSNAGYLAAYQDQAIFSINRDGKDGAFADTGKAAAVVKLISADADSSIQLQTTTSNNAEPISRLTIDKDGAASFTGTIKTAQNYRPAAVISSGTGNNVNYWKLGNIEIHSSHGAILTVFGTTSYSSSTSIAGKTTIMLRGGNSSTVLDGYFFGESEGNGTCNDVVWKNTASNKFDIWVKYGSTYAGLDVSCHGEGVFTAGISDTGSTSAPSGSSQLNSEINFLTAGVSRMRISSSGTVRYANHIAKTGNEGAQFVPDSVGRDVLNTGSTSTGSVGLLHFFDPNGFVSAITTNGGQAQYGTGSDYRLKENLNYSWDASTELKKIKPVKFNYINHKDNTIEGFIAHELQEVVPNAVVYDKDATLSDGSPRYQMVDHSKLVPLLTKSIQEQQIIIDDLKARIETLETEKVIIEESSEEEPKTEETEKVIIEESSDEEPKTEETGE